MNDIATNVFLTLFSAFGMVLLLAWPVAAMPFLSNMKKLIWLGIILFMLIPAVILFIWLGSPAPHELSAPTNNIENH